MDGHMTGLMDAVDRRQQDNMKKVSFTYMYSP